jgi:ABC-type dipeptide/oligopeptide/nickel transport system permease subunit
MSLASSSPASQSVQQNSLWWDAFRRFKRNKVGVISLFTILVYVLIAIGSATGLLYPHTSQGEQYLPMSWQHPFGTDIFGRDILGRAVHGTSTAISIGLLASSLSLVIGVVLGALAGYFGKKVDAAVVWLYTVVDSVPYILLIPALTARSPEFPRSNWADHWPVQPMPKKTPALPSGPDTLKNGNTVSEGRPP